MHLHIEKNLKNANWGYILSMGFLFIFIGIVIASQTKTQAELESIKQAPTRQLEKTTALLKEAEEKKALLEDEVATLRKEVEKMQSSSSPGISKQQIEKIYQIAGLTEVKGNGVKVTLDDRSSSKLSTPDNDGLVHSDDILKLVNELKSAGATAISVNNQRLVTTSEIVEAGGSIMINQTRLVSPYVINAIGEPDALKIALSFRGSILEYLRFYGITIKIEPSKDKLTIPAYTGKL